MKYLNLAQLLNGLDAIKCFHKGIELLLAHRAATLAEGGQSDLVEELNQQIVSAYCATVEIYLTDSCFEEDAEPQCQRLLEEALKYDPGNCEAFQALANLRLTQERKEDALLALQKSYDQWAQCDDLEHLPSFDFRTTTAKLFLELDENDVAADILERLVEEHDGVAELWYLLYLANRSRNPTRAEECLAEAKSLLDKVDGDEVVPFKHLVYELWANLPPSSVEESTTMKDVPSETMDTRTD